MGLEKIISLIQEARQKKSEVFREACEHGFSRDSFDEIRESGENYLLEAAIELAYYLYKDIYEEIDDSASETPYIIGAFLACAGWMAEGEKWGGCRTPREKEKLMAAAQARAEKIDKEIRERNGIQ